MFEEFLRQLAATTWVQWLGMTTGLVGVWMSIKEKIAAWPLFITCYGCYVYISYHHGLIALMGMNIIFICISLYGLWKWSRKRTNEADKLRISRTQPSHWPLVLASLILGTVGLGWLLYTKSTSNLPFFDAFATCCGFVAQWMLSRKQIETWLFWVISDIIYLLIFLQAGDWPSVILFSGFIVLAVKGWRDWRPLIH